MTDKTSTATISEKWVVAFQIARDEPFDSYIPIGGVPGSRTMDWQSAKDFGTKTEAIDEALRIRLEVPSCLASAASIRVMLEGVSSVDHLDQLLVKAFGKR